MFAFDTMNYSLRPNKVIQRYLVFDGLEILARDLPISGSTYIGFGSVWFADFSIAHKKLGIDDMLSIEQDPVLHKRAVFNAPFRTIRVEEGLSTDVLKVLIEDGEAMSKPWVIWLDYTCHLTPEVVEDIDIVVDRAPENSVLLVTVNAAAGNYGRGARARREYVRQCLGGVVPEDAPEAFEKEDFPETLLKYALDYVHSRCQSFARKPGFISAFSIPYRDGSPMVTFGGILPSPELYASTQANVGLRDWPGFPEVPVETPPLTAKESQALLRLLPSDADVSRADVQALGFDLEDEKLRVYCAHYRRYPSFFQVIS